ncbi:LysR family transcriptional regulator [Leisingera thetidis]|uniref:LysR family transcriptional regulator n=1 Tax=Leisingera thetidis TaxID=2930199 RepID=UPI0021F743B7|nr:LysR family transcriptional regulator [Leisingera thetidis]
MNLSIRQIVTFREVMRSGSISQASRTVGRTQPAVSTMIATLESELGFSLFLRRQGKLIPTPEAYFFLEECDAVLERFERIENTVGRIRAHQAGRLSIACHPAASSFFLPRVLTAFMEGKEDLEIALTMRSSDVIEDLIASQQFDIGFAETPNPRPSVTQRDFDLECVCVLPASDPLAAAPALSPADLAGRPMALLFKEHPLTRQTEQVFQQAGCRIRKRLELRTWAPGLQFVADGICYMICDMITAYSCLQQPQTRNPLAIRRFEPRMSSCISILTPGYATRSLVSHAFTDRLCSAIDEMQDEMEEVLSNGNGN